MYKNLVSYDIPVKGKYNTIHLAVNYSTDRKQYFFSARAMNVTHRNGMRVEEYELFSENTSMNYPLQEVTRRTKKQDVEAVKAAEVRTISAVSFLLKHKKLELEVKSDVSRFFFEHVEDVAKEFEKEYNAKYYINPDSREIYTVADWMRYFLDNYDDEALEDYKGDARAWFEDCIRFDTVRPRRAAALIDVPVENGVKVPALVSVFENDDKAVQWCEIWGWSFDDCFTSYKGLFKSPGLWLDDMNNSVLPDDFYSNHDNWYDSEEFEPYLYG